MKTDHNIGKQSPLQLITCQAEVEEVTVVVDTAVAAVVVGAVAEEATAVPVIAVPPTREVYAAPLEAMFLIMEQRELLIK